MLWPAALLIPAHWAPGTNTHTPPQDTGTGTARVRLALTMPQLRDLGGRELCSQTMSLDMDREKEPAVLGEGGKQKGDDPLTSWPAGPAVPSPTGPCREQSHRQGCTGSVSVSRRRTGTGKKALACR